MKATFISQYYKKETGRVVYRYEISGTKEELAQYEATVGDNLRLSDDNAPMAFPTRFYGKSVNCFFDANGKFQFDTSKGDQINSLIEQNPGAVGEHLAKEYAKQLLAETLNSTKASVSVTEDVKQDSM